MPSISVVEPEIHFDDAFHIEYEYGRTLSADQALLAYAYVTQNGSRVWAQYAVLSRGDTEMTTGPTPRWSGGAASGELQLQLSTGGRIRTLAKTPLEILA